MAANPDRSGADSRTEPRRTQRDEFLTTIDSLLPWPRLCAMVEPHRLKDSNPLPAADVERMLRICFVQSWFGLSDRDCGDALIDSMALQRFVGIDVEGGSAPDVQAMRQFRSLLQSQGLAQPLLTELNGVLTANGIRIKPGAISNARIVATISGPGDARPSEAHAAERTQPSFGNGYSKQSTRAKLSLAGGTSATQCQPPAADSVARIAQAVANIRSSC
jgi:IS5 family transposase